MNREEMKDRTYAVIMAGGTGTRFWPASRARMPKQFLPLVGDRSLLQLTIERLEGLSSPENLRLVTGTDYREIVERQLESVSDSTIILESVGKNTAPCVALSAQLIALENPEAVMVVLPSDHYIRSVGEYRETLSHAVSRAERSGSLLTIGIRADRPETGYGYIEMGEALHGEGQKPIHQVNRFHEKPDLPTAIRFLESGSYLWNSGMFVWRVDSILSAFEKHQPDIHETLAPIRGGDRSQDAIDRFFQEVNSISIDYGIMEHADSIEVIPGDFGWSDLGSWESVHEMSQRGIAGLEASDGPVLQIDSENLFTRAADGKLIAVVGVSDLAIIDTDDALLVCKLDQSQKVKEVVQELQKSEDGKARL